MVGVDQQVASESTKVALDLGVEWRTRSVIELLRGLSRSSQDWLVDITHWRPDPSKPPLAPVDEPLRQ